ncbi:hypothetical protein EV702DRAFT_1051521 [Suillus placidus]|uniref:Uncharacterized protein n=1 Tax=Suillus placidus TaxID=48579 RepID=A0A9P6ZFR5_9AGAM|nr:hypothetical protein EV702DRAFT_1051521 [Suillus placidus]
MSESNILMNRVSDYFSEFKPIVDKWHLQIHRSESSLEEAIIHEHIFQMLIKFIPKLGDEIPTCFPLHPFKQLPRVPQCSSAQASTLDAELSAYIFKLYDTTMPLRKKPRHPPPDLEATAQRSSRPNRGVHGTQLQKVGEIVAAPGRKGLKGDDLQISSSEENPMAPLQLQKGKKKPPAKLRSAPKKTQNECRPIESSQHPQDPTSRPNLYVAHSSERFRFKEPQSNGRERASERQPMQKEPQSSGHKTVGCNASQQDVDHEREFTNSGCEKDRQNADKHRELTYYVLCRNRDDGQRMDDDTGDFNEDGGQGHCHRCYDYCSATLPLPLGRELEGQPAIGRSWWRLSYFWLSDGLAHLFVYGDQVSGMVLHHPQEEVVHAIDDDKPHWIPVRQSWKDTASNDRP